MSDDQADQYKVIKEKLIPIFARASIGDFSEDVVTPEGDNDFAEIYAGINIMLDVIRDKMSNQEREIEIRKNAQGELLRREERFQKTLNLLTEGFQIIGFDWRYKYVNDAVIRQSRRSKEELLNHTMMEVYVGIEQQEFFPRLKHCMENRISDQMESGFTYPDGSKGWFELRIEPVPEGVFILSLDISDRKITEEKVAKEKAEAEALLASIGDGIIATDPEGKIILVNKAFEEKLGWSESDLLGKKVTETLEIQNEKGESIPEQGHPLILALQKGEKITETHYLFRRDRTKFPVAITATPVILNQKIIGAVKVIHDMTKEKEVSRAKDEFISLASHELRTPMTAILGLTSMILNGDYGAMNDGLKKPLQNINLSSKRQIQLINDLLDVSRLQMGTIRYQLVDFSIKKALTEVVGSLHPIAEQKGVNLILNEIDDIEVQADEMWAKEIVNNLVGNALKFTDKGSITIGAKLEKDFDLVVVVDTGSGIHPEDQRKLFGRFRQLRNKSEDRTVGSGLGLYISRGVARKMGGDIRLEKSAVGEGSTFVFSVPRAGTAYAKELKEKLEKEMEIAFGKKTD